MLKQNFEWLMVMLASTQDIEKWSHGEVTHPETINYRTGKPKMKGLSCEAIFWPTKNYECSCGKYKWVRYKGIVCERCGVEVTIARVRRERMGHIDLASPVLHVRYKSSPSWWVHQLLGLSSHDIEKVLSFVKYIVVQNIEEDSKDLLMKRIEERYKEKLKELDVVMEEEMAALEPSERKSKQSEMNKLYEENKYSLEKEFSRVKWIITELKYGMTVLESDYRNIFYQFNDVLHLQSGCEAILKMLQDIDVEKKIQAEVQKFPTIKSEDQKKKAFQLIKLLINLHVSGVKPEQMVIRKLPVIPPDLRPVVQLEGGRIATSDVNLFYRRVMMRNLRLKKMIQVGMPDVVKKNEIRLLQESVNNLLVGEKNTVNKMGAGSKLFKSLSDMLSGKEWLFRKNLLGKRVDYSGRSVITVGPDLALDECGLPLYIALKMFTPFIIGKLIEKKIAYTPKQAEKYIREESPLALKILEEVVKGKYVLLNRAPTLHRLSIQAFRVRLMTGKTIRLHPLVCTSFNADFDGDQMAVHLPISQEAQDEAKNLICSNKNLLLPVSSEPTIVHDQDMVLGIYFLTDNFTTHPREAWYFKWFTEVQRMYDNGDLHIKDSITFIFEWEPIKTTVGRVLFNSILPEQVRFVNESVTKKWMKNLLNRIYDLCGMEETGKVADKIKEWWFKYATLAATSINLFDLRVPVEKKEKMKQWETKANKIYTMFYKGFLSEDEKHRMIISTRSKIKTEIEVLVKDNTYQTDDFYNLVNSWAKGSYANVTQISGMKWLIMNTKWETIELPIQWSYAEWLSPIEYFIEAHAWRKGKADTALRTAESWYLTRKLCDSSQEVIVREHDCGSQKYVILWQDDAVIRGMSISKLLFGRVVFEDISDHHGTVIVQKNTLITKTIAEIIEHAWLDAIKVRSSLTCRTSSGVCQLCYGMDLATRHIVELWSPVGIVAAQSLGEPATQLTLNTFHWWWVNQEEWEMTTGIQRIKQLIEVRPPKIPALIAPFDGVIWFAENGRLRNITITSDYEHKSYLIKEWYAVVVKQWELVIKWWTYAQKSRSKLKIKDQGIVLEVHKDHIVIGVTKIYSKSLTWLTPLKTTLWERVYKWEILTSGALDVREYHHIVWDILAQKYIIMEIQKVFTSQGITVWDKHVEVIVKQLFSKVFVEDSGNSSFIPGTHVKYEDFVKINEWLELEWKHSAKWERLILWLTSIAKETDSWLSAASFQETIRVMVDTSLKWSIDTLDDLKSNVIIGRLLPIGHVYQQSLLEKTADVMRDDFTINEWA